MLVYDELRLPAGRRSLTEVREGDDLRKSAAAILRDWACSVRRQGSGEPGGLRD